MRVLNFCFCPAHLAALQLVLEAHSVGSVRAPRFEADENEVEVRDDGAQSIGFAGGASVALGGVSVVPRRDWLPVGEGMMGRCERVGVINRTGRR